MSLSKDLEARLAFMQYDDFDRARLARLRPLLEAHADEFVSAFYSHLLAFPETAKLLRDPATKSRLLGIQRGYLMSLAGPRVDVDYIRDRQEIGRAHERIGLAPRWYLGAYALYQSLLTPMILAHHAGDQSTAAQTLTSLNRLLMLDAQIAIETYVERRETDLVHLNADLIAAQRGLERDYAEQGQELHQTTKRARAAEQLASVGTLVAGLAHEIGTPMGVIQGHAKLLERSVEGDKAHWRLATIQEQIGRISKIIQALLNMARPSSGRLKPVDLEALVETTLSFLTEKFSHRGVEVVRDFSAIPQLNGDPERLQQLCLNLFLNAVDALPKGGEVSVTLAVREEGGISLTIADDGVGIPAEDLPNIFEPFFTSKPAGGGNGLGLMVANGIVSDHGGTMFVSSAPGEGTEFKIDFPSDEAVGPTKS